MQNLGLSQVVFSSEMNNPILRLLKKSGGVVFSEGASNRWPTDPRQISLLALEKEIDKRDQGTYKHKY